MKILMVNKFLYPNGGAETYMFSLGSYLLKLGHQVEYFGMEHEDNCVTNSANAYTENMDFHNSGALQKLKLSLKTIYSKEARQKIRLVLDDFNPDVVHLNNFNYQLTPSIILEIREWEKQNNAKIKIIYTAHDYQLICPNHMLNNPNTGKNCEDCITSGYISCTKNKCVHSSTLKSIIGTAEAMYWSGNNVYSSIDKIICCSAFMKAKLDTSKVLAPKTEVLHNFVDIDTEKKFDKEDYILYFGRFAEEKGIRNIIDVAKNMPNQRFIFAGSGPLEDEINSIDNIENVGFKSGDKLFSLIGKAKASIYPSIWYENCPYSVMESISLGTPVIGADIGGIPELIENEKTGLLFESGNSESLKSAIVKIFEDNELYTNMVNSCDKCFIGIKEYTNKYLDMVK